MFASAKPGHYMGGTRWGDALSAVVFSVQRIKERADPPTAGFQAPYKAVILSDALRSSNANRSLILDTRDLQFYGPLLDMLVGQRFVQ
jgi:hypothetical protein